MNKLTVTYVPTASLVPYAKNSRTHSAKQIEQIKNSIQRFGFTQPILIDSNLGIIAGHGRVLAAAKLKMAKVPTIELGYLSDDEKRAYVIADNKLAENADWDFATLKSEVDALLEADLDIELLGFTEIEMMALLDETPETDEWEDMPEFDQPDQTAFRRIIVNFACQDDVDHFAATIGQELGKKTRSIWHPEQIDVPRGVVETND